MSVFLSGWTADFAKSVTHLNGTIRDEASAAVPGVTVRLTSLDRVLQTESLQDGSFNFEHVPAGSYEMEIKAGGFLRQQRLVDFRTDSEPDLLSWSSKLGICRIW